MLDAYFMFEEWGWCDSLSNLLIDYSVTPFKLKSREPVMIVSKSIIILISESPINILYVGSKNLSAFSEC